jgi:hypothetical protein
VNSKESTLTVNAFSGKLLAAMMPTLFSSKNLENPHIAIIKYLSLREIFTHYA